MTLEIKHVPRPAPRRHIALDVARDGLLDSLREAGSILMAHTVSEIVQCEEPVDARPQVVRNATHFLDERLPVQRPERTSALQRGHQRRGGTIQHLPDLRAHPRVEPAQNR